MSNSVIYVIQEDGDLMWFRHVGREDGSFRWEGPKKVGTGWGELTHVFPGGDGIVYGITPVVEAIMHATGGGTPASGGDLMWFRHIGREDGSFKWEGPKKVGTGWGGFSHVFPGGDGVVYGVTPFVEAAMHATGGGTPASGGDLMWFRHVGREDGSFRWEGPKKVGTGWGGLTHVFPGGDGIVYGVTPFMEAAMHATGGGTPASGGDLVWFRHLGREDGGFRWEGPKKVGTGWGELTHVFPGGDGIVYGITPVVEATMHATGGGTPASGGDLVWFHHLGREDGSFRWEGPKKVGTGWGDAKHVLSGGDDAVTAGMNNNYCGTPDPDRDGSLHPLSFGSPGGRWSRTNLSFSINPAGCIGLTAVEAAAAITQAFGLWNAGGTLLTLQPVLTNGDIQVAFGDADVDERFGTPGGVIGIGHYPEVGRLFFDSIEKWSAAKLLAVAVHEIGHVLGLRHSNTRESIMYPYALTQKTQLANAGTLTVEAESADALRLMYGWSPQVGLADRGTIDRPAMALMSETDFSGTRSSLYMLWRGGSGDSGIYWSRLDGDVWTPQENIPGIGSSHCPSLASVPVQANRLAQGLFMAWKGAEGDQALYWSRNDGEGWISQSQVAGVGSNCRPAVEQFNGQVHMAWKGVDDDNGIYWSTFDGAGWAPQRNIVGIGTSDAPILAALGNRLYMFWKGLPGDSTAYFTSLDDGEGPIWKPQQRISYVEAQVDGMVAIEIGTSGALSACVRGNRIMLAWKGAPGDSSIYFSMFDGQEFTGQIRVDNVGTSAGPTILDVNGQTHMLWKGAEDDSNIYWSRV